MLQAIAVLSPAAQVAAVVMLGLFAIAVVGLFIVIYSRL